MQLHSSRKEKRSEDTYRHLHNLKTLCLIVIMVATSINLNAQTGIWTDSATPWTTGSGTLYNPFKIQNASQLAFLAQQTNAGITFDGVYFQLTNNIDLDEHFWIPIGTDTTHSFKGNFNGAYHTITGLKLQNTTNLLGGLFGSVNNASINGITVTGNLSHSDNTSDFYLGGIAAHAVQSTFINCISNSTISNTINGSSRDAFAGGIVAYGRDCIITDCQNMSIINASSYRHTYTGGILGYSQGNSITRCANIGTIASVASSNVTPQAYHTYAGGICGYATHSTTCFTVYNTGSISANSTYYGYYSRFGYSYAGGICGLSNNSLDLSYCYNTGSINSDSDSSYAGGISGGYGSINNNYNAGTISSLARYRGGLVARGGTVTNSYYLSTCGSNTGGGAAYTESQMKSASFPATLNNPLNIFIGDPTTLLNQGYPIFGNMVYALSLDADPVLATSAVLNGVYSPDADSAGFEYMPYGSNTPLYIGAGDSNVMSELVDGLTDNTTYQYRVILWRNGVPSIGPYMYFTTLDCAIYSNSNNDIVEACDSLLWHGTKYTTNVTTPTFVCKNAVGCDSTTTLQLTIKHSSNNNEMQSACDSYTWHGTTYLLPGTATYTSTNSQGCDSNITLILTLNHSSHQVETINACDFFTWHGATYTNTTTTPTFTTTNAKGCDSVVNLNLTIRHTTYGIDSVVACNSYTWHGNTYTYSTTTPFHTLTSANAQGCDSIVSLHLTIGEATSSFNNVTACDSYYWHGANYTSNIVTMHNTTNAAGCDSTAYLNLIIKHSSDHYNTITQCDSYTWHGVTYTTSTSTPTHTLTNAQGCDSVEHLILTILPSSSHTEEINACDSYLWHGNTYTASVSDATYTTVNAHGCDSTVTLHLSLGHSTSSTESITACDSLLWNGTTYTASTTAPTFSLTNAQGCDSIVSLHLTLRHSTSYEYADTSCSTYHWHGNSYTHSVDNATYTTTNSQGCDSVVTLHLVINSNIEGYDTVSACDHYDWNGMHLTTPGADIIGHTFTAQGCDSTTHLHLTLRHSSNSNETISACDYYTWHGNTYAASTTTPTYTLTNSQGCDSTIHLLLTIHPSYHNTISLATCDSININGITYTNNVNGIQQNLVSQQGCDSIVTINLHIETSQHIDTLVYASNFYLWHHGIINQNGTYSDTLTAENGCDSIASITLTFIYGKPLPTLAYYKNKLLMVNHYPGGQYSRIDYDAYRWRRNGELIEGANKDFLHLDNYEKMYGTFVVEVPTDTTLTTWVPSNSVTFDEMRDEKQLQCTLSPNPAKQGQTVSILLNDANEAATATIYDMRGLSVATLQLQPGSNSFQAQLPKGAYMVVITTGNGHNAQQKLIIQ